MLIPRFREEKEPQYDHLAGRQIFDKVRTRENSAPTTIHVPKDTENPIDVRLRQLAILNEPIDMQKEFCEKHAAVFVQDGLRMSLYTGRIKDVYFVTRDIRIKTRKGQDVIVNFGNVMQIDEHEL